MIDGLYAIGFAVLYAACTALWRPARGWAYHPLGRGEIIDCGESGAVIRSDRGQDMAGAGR
jgi:hypothetical protein